MYSLAQGGTTVILYMNRTPSLIFLGFGLTAISKWLTASLQGVPARPGKAAGFPAVFGILP